MLENNPKYTKFRIILSNVLDCVFPSRRSPYPRSFSDFFLPKLDRCFFIRAGILILLAVIFFKFICVPVYIKGGSMRPTYPPVGFNFCWRPAFMFSKPKRFEIIILKYGSNSLLLKRVIAFPGEKVEFKDGTLYINGEKIDEPYVKYTCDWNLPERTVKPDHIYVVGDNRSMPLKQHQFGQISTKRIHGVPLW